MGIREFALSMLQNSPQVMNNPRAQEMFKVIQDNDAVKGQQIAQNLCNTYGVSKEEATNQAKRFFGL